MPFGLATEANQTKILANQEKIMTALTDLQGAEASLATAVAAAVTDIQTLAAQLAALPSVSDADAATITSELNTLATNLNNAVTPPAAPAVPTTPSA